MEKFTGPGLKNLTEDDLNKFKQERIVSGLVKKEHEMKTTHEEEIIFNKMVGFLNEELNSLGLPNINFPIERFHVVESWSDEKYVPGEYNGQEDSLTVRVSRYKDLEGIRKNLDDASKLLHLPPIPYLLNKPKDIMIILHELIHSRCLSGFFVDKEGNIRENKSGYVSSDTTNPNGYTYFRGFNEAVTQKLTVEIFNKNKDKLFKKADDKKVGYVLEDIPYRGYMCILDNIIKSIAESEYKNENEIWLDFKKNYFTGEMMCLRKIEKVFGIGSLRVLAAMDRSTMSTKGLEENSKFLKYFSNNISNTERDILAREILSDVENSKRDTHKQIISNISKNKENYL